MLHFTNGDCAVALLRAAGIAGAIHPWRDVLHEGPVDAALPLEKLSAQRARFICEAGWAPCEAVERHFKERDEALVGACAHEEVVLWFEHDLYDQLQLIQLLAWFAAHPHPRLALVCEAEYLGRMAPERAQALFASRKEVSALQEEQARDAWLAFGSGDPSALAGLDTSALPFLGPALRRLQEEYPWTSDGLSRLERAVLEALPAEFPALFAAVQEEPAFLGDTVLRWRLERMALEKLVAQDGKRWTKLGGRKEKVLPRWLGGVLLDASSPWAWDARSGRLVRLR